MNGETHVALKASPRDESAERHQLLTIPKAGQMSGSGPKEDSAWLTTGSPMDTKGLFADFLRSGKVKKLCDYLPPPDTPLL